MGRTFEDRPATRERVPLLIGIMGPSGGGKTYSALRLATGIQRVVGGETFVIDTESRRALHYADRFRFRHVAFGAPFGPLDYLDAVEHCVKQGAKTIVIDSMSHEHEGPGGVLEQHEQETDRLSKLWNCRRDAAQMTAWAKPKADRRRMINTMMQLPCNFVVCFRAKEKLKIAKGEQPKQMGYMAIAGEEFVYEMTLNTLLLPGANGVPTWQSEEPGEAAMIKIPAQFRKLLVGRDGPLDEEVGESLARWAVGEDSPEYARLAARIAAVTAVDELAAVRAELTAAKAGKGLKRADLAALGEAFSARAADLAADVSPAVDAPPDAAPTTPEPMEPGSGDGP